MLDFSFQAKVPRPCYNSVTARCKPGKVLRGTFAPGRGEAFGVRCEAPLWIGRGDGVRVPWKFTSVLKTKAFVPEDAGAASISIRLNQSMGEGQILIRMAEAPP
jgi:hypothetical protein